MVQVQLKTQHEPPSYSNYPQAFGATMIAALLYNQVFAAQNSDTPQVVSRDWQYEVAGVSKSYHNLHVVQTTPETQLTIALQSLYESLATEQEELEPETKDILYANLWSLYT